MDDPKGLGRLVLGQVCSDTKMVRLLEYSAAVCVRPAKIVSLGVVKIFQIVTKS